jgi:hypothetical protein
MVRTLHFDSFTFGYRFMAGGHNSLPDLLSFFYSELIMGIPITNKSASQRLILSALKPLIRAVPRLLI